MGCNISKIGGVTSAGRANDVDVVPIPSGIRPLLRRRLEEMKKRSHASVLKGKQTLSKKELLTHGSSDEEETEENEGSLKSSAKVAPTPPEHHVEEKKEVIYEKIVSKDDVKEVKEEEVVKNDHDATTIKKEGDYDGINLDAEVINVKKEDDDVGRMANFDERMICPGSPSFRVYCMNMTSSDDDEDEKESVDTRKSTETESITTEPKEEESISKMEKKKRKGMRFGLALPKKYLANVTAPCYAGGGGCMGNNTHSRLVEEKSSSSH